MIAITASNAAIKWLQTHVGATTRPWDFSRPANFIQALSNISVMPEIQGDAFQDLTTTDHSKQIVI